MTTKYSAFFLDLKVSFFTKTIKDFLKSILNKDLDYKKVTKYLRYMYLDTTQLDFDSVGLRTK